MEKFLDGLAKFIFATVSVFIIGALVSGQVVALWRHGIVALAPIGALSVICIVGWALTRVSDRGL
jgi:hypothetical protein